MAMGSHSGLPVRRVGPMEVDEPGLAAVGLILSTEATFDSFSREYHHGLRVGHRFVEVKEDPPSIPGIHPEMVRHGRMERFPCVRLGQGGTDVFESLRGRTFLAFSGDSCIDTGAPDQQN